MHKISALISESVRFCSSTRVLWFAAIIAKISKITHATITAMRHTAITKRRKVPSETTGIGRGSVAGSVRGVLGMACWPVIKDPFAGRGRGCSPAWPRAVC